MELASNTPECFVFGRFRVLVHRRELLADDVPIKLGGRAFDLLMALIESPGAIVSKEDLLTRVWPDRVVAENNLQTQILALRQAFGAERDLIRTVARRGYQFNGKVSTGWQGPDKRVAAKEAIEVVAPPTNLPQPVSELIGRTAEIDEVSNLVRAGRLVTLTGAGGIGKTRLALAVARLLLPQFPDGVWLIEFSPLADPALVPATIAAAVGLEPGGGTLSAQRVAQALAGRRLLVLLDTCEHVIDAAATMAEAILRAGSSVHIIATSREPLRAEGEQLYLVPPLAVPPGDSDDYLQYGAVRLFVERARAAEPGLAPNPHWVATAAAICRRLDGIPLAIEMAAARLATLGVEELATRLDDRLQLLTGGRRTALPRHQTLRATLDWSHDLLPEPERVLLRRLAIFAGAFSLEAVTAVVTSDETALPEVVDGLSSLVGKSLIVAEVDATAPRYRFLDTTRAYASERLNESGEQEWLARRHAEYYRDLFERAEAELEERPTGDWLGDYGRQIDNLRAALDWAFSGRGDGLLGVMLTTAAAPFWLRLSRLEEVGRRAKQALGALEATETSNPREEMRLHAAVGASLPGAPEMEAAFLRALDIARTLDDMEYELRALRGLYFYNTGKNHFLAALSFAQRFHDLVPGRRDRSDRLLGERMLGSAKYFLGDLAGARDHLEHVLTRYIVEDLGQPTGRFQDVIRFQNDGQVEARAFLARVLWLQGFPDQAIQMAEKSLSEAQAIGHIGSQCFALALASCPLALWTGDLDAAELCTKLLLRLSDRHGLSHWGRFGVRYRTVITLRRRNAGNGSRQPDASPEEIDQSDPGFRSLTGLAELVEALIDAGRSAEAAVTLDNGAPQSSETGSFTPELLRLRGELLLSQSAAANTQSSEELFRQGLDLAQEQRALSWELRAATSLARLLCKQNRQTEAIVCLQSIRDRFTEGFGTADLMVAKRVLDEMGVDELRADPF